MNEKNIHSSVDEYIKKIANLSKKINMLVFDRTICGKWKLKLEQDVNAIIEKKIQIMHDDLCRNIKTLHNGRQYYKAFNILKNHHNIMIILDEIANLTKKYYVAQLSEHFIRHSLSNRPRIIEYFSTENT